jgi:hypothetical protein
MWPTLPPWRSRLSNGQHRSYPSESQEIGFELRCWLAQATRLHERSEFRKLNNVVSAEETRRAHPTALRGDYETTPEPMIFWRTTVLRTLRLSGGNGGTGLLHRTWQSQGG